jgi:hypothetical protein
MHSLCVGKLAILVFCTKTNKNVKRRICPDPVKGVWMLPTTENDVVAFPTPAAYSLIYCAADIFI